MIIDSQPLSVAVLASILFGETLSGAGYVGLVVGLLGLVLLEVTPETISSLLNDGAHIAHRCCKLTDCSFQSLCKEFMH